MHKCNICGEKFDTKRGMHVHRTKEIKKQQKTGAVEKTYAPGIAVYSNRTSKKSKGTTENSQFFQFYTLTEWARSAIDLIVRSCVTSGFRMSLKQYAKDLSPEIIAVVEEFFERPNEEDHMEDLLMDISSDLLTFGNAYFEYVVDNAKVPKFKKDLQSGKLDPATVEFPAKLYIIDASTVSIMHDGKRITGYKQKTQDGQDIVFSPSQVIHFKLPSPGSDLYGMSPMKTLANAMAADIFASSYNVAFFENNATPRLHIDIGNSTPDQLQEFANVLETKLKGSPHKNLVTSGGVKVEPISTKNKDMEFDMYSRRLRERIFSVFGVQPAILGLDDNVEDLEQQIKLFTNLTVKPLQKLMSRRINRKVMMTLFSGLGIEMKFNPISGLDLLEFRNAENLDLQNAVRTINEVRADRGLSAVSWGNTPVIPFSDANLAVMDESGKNPSKDDS